MTFPILFPQYAKSSMDSSTKIPKKFKTVYLYEILLNIPALLSPVHCVSFYKIAFKRSSLYEAHTELIKAKIQLKIKETAHHFSKTSCDLSPLSARPSLQSMWNY